LSFFNYEIIVLLQRQRWSAFRFLSQTNIYFALRFEPEMFSKRRSI